MNEKKALVKELNQQTSYMSHIIQKNKEDRRDIADGDKFKLPFIMVKFNDDSKIVIQ